MAGVEVGAKRRRRRGQLGIVHPDLAWPADLAADLFDQAIALLLLRRHLVIRYFGVTAKGRHLGHFSFLMSVG
jgi:hypothetical protein